MIENTLKFIVAFFKLICEDLLNLVLSFLLLYSDLIELEVQNWLTFYSLGNLIYRRIFILVLPRSLDARINLHCLLFDSDRFNLLRSA